MTMRIFLTGGTGLLGAHLVESLSSAKDVERIYCLVRDQTRAEIEFSERNVDLHKIRYLQGDITRPDLSLSSADQNALKNIDVVYHLPSQEENTIGPQPNT